MTQAEATRSREPLEANVRKATPADRQRLTATMARAFDDDPIANWFAVQDKRRARRILDFLDTTYQMMAPHGEIYTTDDLRGGAYWASWGVASHRLRLGHALKNVPVLDFHCRGCSAARSNSPALMRASSRSTRRRPATVAASSGRLP